MISRMKKYLLTAVAAIATLGTTGAAALAHEPTRVSPYPVSPVPSYRSGWTSYYHDDHGRGRRFEYIDRLAMRLEREARALNRETDAHFRNAPDYRAFERMVDEIARLADHIHDLAHQRGSLRHMREDVERLDRLFHQAERLFDRMVAFRRLDRQTVFHVKRALNTVERTMHELRDAIN